MVIVVMALLFGIGGLLYKYSQSGTSVSGQRAGKTASQFDRIEAAIVDYVKTNRRLPCPALPTDGTGGNLATATATCATPDGVLPWGSLGLDLSDALDGWGRKISYRVYSPNTGTGFTQAGGMDASDCNSSSLLTSTAVPLLANGLCATTPAHGTPSADFFTGKGLTVNELSVPKSGIAYVLISHGATGYGSYGVDHTANRYVLPNAASHESNNVGAAGTYYLDTESATSVDPSSAAHFDDMLRYKSATDLVALAKLNARDWGWVSLTKSFSNTNLVVNANPTQTSTLTLTFANTGANPATLTSALVDNLPSLAIASSPNYSGTPICGGTTYSPTANSTTITLPVGFAIPAATGSGASKVNGTCTVSLDVYSVATMPGLPLVNTIAAGTAAGGGMQTSAGWNLSTATSNSISYSFNTPTLTAASPAPVISPTNPQLMTLTGTGFVTGATVVFTNLTLGQTNSVVASTVSSDHTTLTVNQTFPASNGSWTAGVTNPDTKSTGTASFYVYSSPASQNTLTAASLSAALGYAVTAGSSTGTGTINFNDFTLTSFTTGWPNIASLTNSGFNGIGVATSAGVTSEITSAHTGGIRMTLPSPYRYFGVTLFRFGIAALNATERASVAFYNSGGTLIATQTIKACSAGSGTQAASYTLDPGASFSKVEITPLNRTVTNAASSFQLGELAFCLTTSSCVTHYSANNNASNCAYP